MKEPLVRGICLGIICLCIGSAVFALFFYKTSAHAAGTSVTRPFNSGQVVGGGTSGKVIFYDRSVQFIGQVAARGTTSCMQDDFTVWAGTSTLSTAQRPTNTQQPNPPKGFVCNNKTSSFNFTLPANVAGGASSIQIELTTYLPGQGAAGELSIICSRTASCQNGVG